MCEGERYGERLGRARGRRGEEIEKDRGGNVVKDYEIEYKDRKT